MLLACFLIVAATLAAASSRLRGPRVVRAKDTRGGWLAAYLAVLVAMAPLLRGASRFVAADAILPSDAQAHAWVAAEIARGIPHGWVAVCSGGFPFGPHYQSVAIAIAAFAMKVGVAPITAVNSLGLVATLAAPLLLV